MKGYLKIVQNRKVPDSESEDNDDDEDGEEWMPEENGLTLHMENAYQVRPEHTCIICKRTFSQKANLKNHGKKCQGTTSPTKHVRTLKDCSF